VVDLFAKASEGRSSGDSPCAKSVVISDAETSLADVEVESEPLCDTAAPTVTVHDLTEIKADDSSNTVTDNSAEICNMPTSESITATSSSESLSGSVTPAPSVLSKAPTKRARASRAKAVPAPTKRQKAMASTASAIASASASVVLPAVSDAEELQQDGEAVAMEVEVVSISDTGAEQSIETSVRAAITEESFSEMCVEEPKPAVAVAVGDVGLKKRKRTATVSANALKKEEIVLSAEVLKKIECITTRISQNLGDLAVLER
jgi:hypothetical protein